MTVKNKIMVASFSMFMIEGFVNYTVGINASLPKEERRLFHKPSGKDLILLAASVAVFSFLTAQVVDYVSEKV